MTSVRGIGPLPALLDRMEGPHAAAQLFAEAGLPIDVAGEAERMVPLNNLIMLYEAAARMTGDPLLGLKTGRAMIDAYGTWVAYSRAAPTLRGCLQRAARAIAYHQTGTALRLSTSGSRAQFTYHIFGLRPAERLQHLQHTIPALLSSFRCYAGQHWKPDWIELDVAYDQRIEAMARALSVPIRSGSHAMAFAFPSRLLENRRNVRSEPLSQPGWRDLKTMVQGRPPNAFSALVRETIHLDLLTGTAQINGVADRLGLGPRTIQRRLKAESSSYRQLVSDVRMERARTLLAGSEMSVTEIAFRLGYSDSTHLTRAFAQSQGMSPIAFRRANKGL